jgi:hypothetical protein
MVVLLKPQSITAAKKSANSPAAKKIATSVSAFPNRFRLSVVKAARLLLKKKRHASSATCRGCVASSRICH